MSYEVSARVPESNGLPHEVRATADGLKGDRGQRLYQPKGSPLPQALLTDAVHRAVAGGDLEIVWRPGEVLARGIDRTVLDAALQAGVAALHATRAQAAQLMRDDLVLDPGPPLTRPASRVHAFREPVVAATFGLFLAAITFGFVVARLAGVRRISVGSRHSSSVSHPPTESVIVCFVVLCALCGLWFVVTRTQAGKRKRHAVRNAPLRDRLAHQHGLTPEDPDAFVEVFWPLGIPANRIRWVLAGYAAGRLVGTDDGVYAVAGGRLTTVPERALTPSRRP